jgi:hypothetical protein
VSSVIRFLLNNDGTKLSVLFLLIAINPSKKQANRARGTKNSTRKLSNTTRKQPSDSFYPKVSQPFPRPPAEKAVNLHRQSKDNDCFTLLKKEPL